LLNSIIIVFFKVSMSCHLINLYLMMLTQNMDCMTTIYILICTAEAAPTCVEHSRASSAEKVELTEQ